MLCTLLVLTLSSFHPGIYSLCFSCGIAATHRPRRYHGTPQLLQPALSEHPPFYQSYSCRSHSPPATAAQWLCAPAGPYLRTWANFHSKVPKRVGVVKALRYRGTFDLEKRAWGDGTNQTFWRWQEHLSGHITYCYKMPELEGTLATSSPTPASSIFL